MSLRGHWCGILFGLAAWLHAPSAHTQARLADIQEGTNLTVALSPDGTTLLIDLMGRLWSLPATGGAASPLTPDGTIVRYPRFSPDGRSVAYQQQTDGQWDIWQLSLADGAARALTSSPQDDYEPDYSPDGRRIVFVSTRSGTRQLWTLELATGRLTQLTFGAMPAAYPAVSEQNVIAYVGQPAADTYTLELLPADAPATEVYRSSRRLAAPSWRPGGGAIVFNEAEPWSRSELRLLLLSAAPLVKTLTHDEDVFGSRVAWTESGEIVYTADGRIWRRGLALTTRYPIPLFAAVPVAPMAAPQVAPVLTRQMQSRPAQILDPRPSPDGRDTVYVALGDVWLAHPRGDIERLTNDPWVELDPEFSTDRDVVFASDRSGNIDLWQLSLDNRILSQLTHGQEKDYAPAVSPDGRQLAFLSTADIGPGAPHTLRILDVARPERMTLVARGLIAPSRPTWTDDGRALEVSAATEASPTLPGLLRIEVPAGVAAASPRLAPDRQDRPDAESLPAPEWTPSQPKDHYVIQAGRLFDGIGNQYRRHVDIHIEGNRITAVVGRGLAPLPAKVIDARDLTVMPGLFDLHAHPTDLAGERLGRTWLYFGVTAIQDAGTDTAAALARSQAWASGRRLGPRAFIALAPQGAPAPSAPASDSPQAIGITSAEALAEAAQSGRALPQFSTLGRSYQDVINVLAGSGQVFIPTVAALGGVWRQQVPAREIRAYEALFAAPESARSGMAGPTAATAIAATAAAVLRAGGHIGLGSDAPAVPYGLGLHAELALLSAAGLPNDQLLRIATSGAALALGLEGELGSIESGKLADLLVLSGDPLARISDSLSLVAIVKDGQWFERESLRAAPKSGEVAVAGP